MRKFLPLILTISTLLFLAGCTGKNIPSVLDVVASDSVTTQEVVSPPSTTRASQVTTRITTNSATTITVEEELPDEEVGSPTGYSVEQSQEFPIEGKIAIICNSRTNSYEEYYSAQKVVKKYGEDKITQVFWPDSYTTDWEREEMLQTILELGDDPEVRVIITNQTKPGVDKDLQRLLEVRDDMFIICIEPFIRSGINVEDLCNSADFVLQVDYIGMGPAMVRQAKALGANTFVHYYTYSHQFVDGSIIPRIEELRKTCEQYGITFLEKIIPHSQITFDIDWFIEDMEKVISCYGLDTAFFKAHRIDSEYFAKVVIDLGAILPQTERPSPYGGLDRALLDPSYLRLSYRPSYEEIIALEREALAEKNMLGRVSFWPMEASDLLTNASVEYAMKWMNGEVPRNGVNVSVLNQLMEEYSGVEVFLTPYVDTDVYYYTGVVGSGKTYDNFLLMRMDYITF